MQPALIIHTGDITHLSKPDEFDLPRRCCRGLNVTELHTVPGEHDVTDGPGTEYLRPLRQAVDQRGYYSFDHQGVHFVALINVMNFKPGGLGRAGRRPAGLAEGRSDGPLVQHADRGVRAHAAVDDLRALGLGHRRCRADRWRCCAASVRSPC